MSTPHVIEIAKFRLAAGVSEDAFLQTVPATSDFASTLPGFVRRNMVITDEGDIFDIVEWASLADAQNAADVFSPDTQPELGPFMACLDMSGGAMMHTGILHNKVANQDASHGPAV